MVCERNSGDGSVIVFNFVGNAVPIYVRPWIIIAQGWINIVFLNLILVGLLSNYIMLINENKHNNSFLLKSYEGLYESRLQL